METKLKHSVKTYRAAGLEAKWGKVNGGTPAIFVRNPKAEAKHQRETWWMITNRMFDDMKEVGIVEAFTRHTLLGDIFSVEV